MSADRSTNRADTTRPLFGLVAEFDDPTAVTRAARAVRDAGYRQFDVYSPFPIHGIERAMGVRPTKLPWMVLAAGVSGLGLALLLQWWTNAFDYPFRISGKPLFGVPANIPITFEVTVLLSAFAAFFGMLILNRLPEHHHPLFEMSSFARATDDGFFLAIEAQDACFDPVRTRALLQAHTRHPVEECRATGESDAFPAWVKHAMIGGAALLIVPLGLIGISRGADSTLPAVHLVPDMDSQPRFRAQTSNDFFADGRAQRPDAEGTVAHGTLVEDVVFATGKRGDAWTETIPVTVDERLLLRGRERFGIYCAPCHGQAGYGDGLVATRARDLQEPNWVPPASLHDPLVRTRSVGQVFDTVRNGVRTMPAYGRQVDERDSWAIVAYVRALQRSQHATVDDVPAEERARLGLR